MTEQVSADTDDLDEFVEHGQSRQRPLNATYQTLVRQRTFLLEAGFSQVVDHSQLPSLENSIILLGDLDTFVGEISVALKQSGQNLGDGMFAAPATVVQRRLDRTDDARLDALEDALIEEGVSPQEAERIRMAVEASAESNPRFEVDGATLSEPEDLAAAIVARNREGTTDLIEDNTHRRGGHNATNRLSPKGLAEDVYYGNLPDGITSFELLDAELRSQLTEEQYEQFLIELAGLDQNATVADLSLLSQDGGFSNGDVSNGEVVDGDPAQVEAEARALYRDNYRVSTGGRGSGSAGLDEPELAYQLQKLADEDPVQAYLVKQELESMLSSGERTELNRLLATNGDFGEGINVAIRHPRDGVEGGAKGWWNNNFGWWTDWWADSTVAITYGFWGMGTGNQVPENWEEIDSVVEMEFEMDNIGQQGGADIVVIGEVASAAYGIGKGGMTLVQIGRRFFLTKGDDVVAEVSPRVARQLDQSRGVREVAESGLDQAFPRSRRSATIADSPFEDADAAIESGTSHVGTGTGRNKNNFPDRGAPNEVKYRTNADGEITYYQIYDDQGRELMRVDIDPTSAVHNSIPPPHVQEYEVHVNPLTGREFVRPGKVRPAEANEVPTNAAS